MLEGLATGDDLECCRGVLRSNAAMRTRRLFQRGPDDGTASQGLSNSSTRAVFTGVQLKDKQGRTKPRDFRRALRYCRWQAQAKPRQ
jgi:hypothetical protein